MVMVIDKVSNNINNTNTNTNTININIIIIIITINTTTTTITHHRPSLWTATVAMDVECCILDRDPLGVLDLDDACHGRWGTTKKQSKTKATRGGVYWALGTGRRVRESGYGTRSQGRPWVSFSGSMAAPPLADAETRKWQGMDSMRTSISWISGSLDQEGDGDEDRGGLGAWAWGLFWSSVMRFDSSLAS
jgi:hypothetical protein